MANNLIQIKRSLNTAVPSSLANGEMAFTSNGDVLFIGANGAVEPIAGKRYPGVLTANQALVANATSGIDKIIVANASISQLSANGTTGSSGQVLKSAGPGGNTFWATETAGVAGANTQIQYNDSGSLTGAVGFTYDKTTNGVSMSNTLAVTTSVSTNTFVTGSGLGQSVAGSTSNTTVIGISTNSTVNTTVSSTQVRVANSTASANLNALGLSAGISVVNSTVIAVGTNNFINATALDIGNTVMTSVLLTLGGQINANGGVGSAGQVLTSGAAGNVYWTTPTTGDITAVTAGNGLTGGGTAGDVTLDVGAGAGITVAADTVAVNANNGLVANSTGVFVVAGDGLTVNATGVHVGAANGITVAADTVAVTGANGISVTTSGVNVQAGTNGGLVSNSTGVWVAAGNGVNVGAGGVGVTGGNGLVSNATGVHVGAANGITVDADAIRVTEGVGLVVNTTGVHVRANSGIIANSTGTFVAANTTGGLLANTTLQVKVGSGLVFDGSGNVAVNSAALSFQDLTVSGNLTVLGDLVSMNVATLAIEDPLIALAKDQSNTGTYTDAVDIGFYGSYGNTAQKNWTGFFRDQSDSGVFKLFSGNIPEPTTTVDTANVNFAYSTLQSFIRTGGAGATGLIANATHIAITANSTLNVAIVANTLSLSSPLAGTSGGTGKATMTSQAILVGNTTNGYAELTLGTVGRVLQSNGTALVYDTLDGGTF